MRILIGSVVAFVVLVGVLQPQRVHTTEVLFGGDMLFDRYIRLVSERQGTDFVFSCIDEVLAEVDVVIANLEGPITSFPSVSTGTVPGSDDNFVFTFPEGTAELLARYNIGIVNIGNNHIGNFGAGGIEQTKELLAGAGVEYIGDPPSHAVVKRNVNGVPLAFISFTEFGGSLEKAVSQVQSARTQGYIPIVYAHWGDEYVGVGKRVRAYAYTLVDAGAGLIVGSHPHVVHPSEVHKGTPIYYSLGNFIFDQYFSHDVRSGLLLKVSITQKGDMEFTEIPVYLESDGRTCRAQR
jgi:poly-gamma-glutamate synthesis protein (capsule biosynthesis protein)